MKTESRLRFYIPTFTKIQFRCSEEIESWCGKPEPVGGPVHFISLMSATR